MGLFAKLFGGWLGTADGAPASKASRESGKASQKQASPARPASALNGAKPGGRPAGPSTPGSRWRPAPSVAGASAPAPELAAASPQAPEQPEISLAATASASEELEDPTTWFSDDSAPSFSLESSNSMRLDSLGSGSFDSLVSQFDEFLASPSGLTPGIGSEEPGVPASQGRELDEALLQDEIPEVREMFEAIAAVYVRPVRQFLARLSSGPVSREWLDMCVPAVGMVGRSARSMGLTLTAPKLEAFEALLTRLRSGDGVLIEGDARDAVLAAYAELSETLPAAFAANEQSDHSDTLIMHALLRQVPDVGKVTLDKVFGAGLTSIDTLERATVEDLSVTTGLSMRLADRICAAVQSYAKERNRRRTADSPATWLGLLSPLTADLEEQNTAFQRLADADDSRPEEAAARRLLRRERQQTALKIEVLLAEMGEAGLAEELQALPFDARIRRLRGFLPSLSGEVEGPDGAAGAAAPSQRE